MRFLVDENIEYALVPFLREKGHDVLSITENYRSLDDHSILRMALEEKRVIITGDKDFCFLVFKEKYETAGIILFRLQDQSAAAKLKHLLVVLESYPQKIAGHFIVISDRKIRIRKIERLVL